MRSLALAVLLLAAACGRSAPDGSIELDASRLGFAATVPGDWRADFPESGPRRAVFYGPPDGPRPFAEVVSVYRHDRARWGSTEALLLSLMPFSPMSAPPAPGAREARFERVVANPHGPTERRRVRVVVVEAPDGWYTLEHEHPGDGWVTADFFDRLVATFKPATR